MADNPLDQILSAPTSDPLDEILALAPDADIRPGDRSPPLASPASGASLTQQLLGTGIPEGPQPGEHLRAVWDWIQRNPQEAADIVGQTIGTGGGIALGTATGGPPGGIAGGAAGNVLGKQVSRTLGGMLGFPGSERPELLSTETAVDAGLGATGPVLSKVGQGVARVASGLSRKGVTEAEKKGAAEVSRHTAAQKAVERQLRSPESAAARMREPTAENLVENSIAVNRAFHQAIGSAIQRARDLTKVETEKNVTLALKAALDKARGREVKHAAWPAGAMALLGPLEPITGALVGAGVGDVLLSRAVPRLLRSEQWGPRFAKWALDVEKKAIKPGEIATSFAALAAEAGVKSGLDEQAQEQDSRPPRETSRPQPLRGSDGRFRSPRMIDDIADTNRSK